MIPKRSVCTTSRLSAVGAGDVAASSSKNFWAKLIRYRQLWENVLSFWQIWLDLGKIEILHPLKILDLLLWVDVLNTLVFVVVDLECTPVIKETNVIQHYTCCANRPFNSQSNSVTSPIIVHNNYSRARNQKENKGCA